MESSSFNIASMLPAIKLDIPLIGALDITIYIAALIVFLGLTIAFKFIQVVIIKRLNTLSKKTTTNIDDVVIDAIQDVPVWVYTIIALYFSLQLLILPEIVSNIIFTAVYIAVAYQVIEILLKFVKYGVGRFLKKNQDSDSAVDANIENASHLIILMARIILWAFGIIFVLSNLGIEVTSLIAGLGIGGIAIAFALQGVLSDLFSSFSIYADKPFKIGDFVVLGTDSGVVERIGIKTTRIRTLQGEELVVSNSELTTTRIQNFKKMKERRIATRFGITYETPHEKVKLVNGVVEDIINSIDGIRFDRVHFAKFADSSLLFEVVFHVDSPDYADFMDGQQTFNFALLDKFAELGIDFAYPTQTIYTKSS